MSLALALSPSNFGLSLVLTSYLPLSMHAAVSRYLNAVEIQADIISRKPMAGSVVRCDKPKFHYADLTAA